MKKLLTALWLLMAGVIFPSWADSPSSPNRNPVQSKAKVSNARQNAVRPTVNQVQLKGLDATYPAAKAFSGRIAQRNGNQASRITRPPMRIGSTGSTLYGWLTSYNDPMGLYPMVGLNEVSLDGRYTNVFNRNDATAGGGFIRDGRVCVFSLEAIGGEILGAYYREFDLHTGELVVQQSIDTTYGMNNIYVSFAYDETSDMVYGYSYNREASGYTFSCSPGYDPSSLTVIRDVSFESAETCTSMTYNPVTGTLVGVNLDRNLVEIAPDGTQTVILSLQQAGSVGIATGLVYSPVDGKYVWNCSDMYGDAYLYAIDPVSKSVSKLFDYELGEVFAFFVTTDEKQDNLAPCVPEITGNTFAGTPSLSGSFTVKLPSELTGGQAINGNVTLTAKVDGDVRTSVHAAGSTATVNFDNLAEGMHSFIFAAEVNGHSSKSVRRSFFTGYDTPCQPAEVFVTDTEISWTPVSEGVNAGFIDPAEVTYDVVLDGVALAYGVKGTSIKHDFGSTVEAHVAQVCAKYHGKESAYTMSGKFISGGAMQLPVHIVPTEAQAELLTFVDVNLDNSSWYWAHDYYGNEFLGYEYSPTERADDWVILPAISFPDAGKRYEIAFEAYNDLYDERIEVCMGARQAVSAMTMVLVPPTDILNRDPKVYKAVFDVPEAGAYYIGFHAISDPDKNRLYVQNIQVSETNMSQNGPDAVTGLTAVETAPGELKAKVTFTMPTKLITGQEIDASASLAATVTSPAGTATVSGRPGETVNATVATKQSMNTISVQAALGADNGLMAETEVYTGVDLPGRVKNLTSTMSEDNCTIHLSWQPPTEGANGGYISQTGITYLLMGVVPGVFGNEMGVIATIGEDVLEYDYAVEQGTDQTEVILGVLATNAAGQAPRYVRISSAAGKPYEMPLTERFNDYKVTYEPLLFLEPTEEYEETVWGVTNPGILGEVFITETGGGVICTGDRSSAVSRGRAALPKISTIGAVNPVVTIEYAGAAADVEVYAEAYGKPLTIVGRISDFGYSGQGYEKFAFTLPPQFAGCTWVQIYIDAIFNGGNNMAIASYDVRNYVARDLGITSLKVPGMAEIGKPVEVKAEITNFGYEASSLPALKWQITRNGEAVAEHIVPADASVTVEPAGKTTVSHVFVPDTDMAGDVEAVLTLVGDDANSVNNIASAAFSVSRGDAIAVTDLIATHGDGGVTLSWTVPVSDRVQCSFEEEEPFEANMQMLGGFRNVDRDGKEIYCFSGWPSDSQPYAGEPAAFIAYSAMGANAIVGIDGLYSASDGDIYLIAFCPADGMRPSDADDWLISPPVQGGSEVTVDLRAITYQYGAETVELLASSTDDNPASFSLVKTFKVSGVRNEETVWETFSATLPADAKYFAIRYASNDIMGIQLDNICYVSATAVSPVTGYDIYRDDALIAENVKCDGSYTDATAATGPVYRYHVVPVIGDKRCDRSNVVTVDTSGLDAVEAAAKMISGLDGRIVVTGYTGCDICVYAADGVMVAERTDAPHNVSIPLGKGIYLVKAADDVVKVLVK